MGIKNKKTKLSELSVNYIKLMESGRGVQSALAKKIGKKPSYFSEIRRGNPVNAQHLKAAGLLFGPQKVIELLFPEYGRETIKQDAKSGPGSTNDHGPLLGHGQKKGNGDGNKKIHAPKDLDQMTDILYKLSEIKKLKQNEFHYARGMIDQIYRTVKFSKKGNWSYKAGPELLQELFRFLVTVED